GAGLGHRFPPAPATDPRTPGAVPDGRAAASGPVAPPPTAAPRGGGRRMNTTTPPPTPVQVPVTVWEPRTYPGDLAQLRKLRQDLPHDLAGFDADFVDTVHLCASELLANAIKYTDSGLPGGQVLRFLSRPTTSRLRSGLNDEGGSGTAPRIPTERSVQAWEWAEGQRGLEIIEQLSTARCYHRAAPRIDLGPHVWPGLAVTPRQAPRHPRPYVSAD